jgi:CRP-like cAMP-binding protein
MNQKTQILLFNRTVELELFDTVHTPKNCVIIGHGDPHSYLYYLYQGRVHQILNASEMQLPVDRLKISSVKKGTLFGLATLDGSVSESQFVAASPCVLYRIKTEELLVHFDRMQVQACGLLEKSWVRQQLKLISCMTDFSELKFVESIPECPPPLKQKQVHRKLSTTTESKKGLKLLSGFCFNGKKPKAEPDQESKPLYTT